MSNADFYRAFEERHRGSRELIKQRLRVYLPFITPLKEIYDDCHIIDLGCGRGEWLELTTEAGFSAYGIDLDDGMLAACRERQLTIETQDAITALKNLPDSSQVIVSGFHLAEHLPFETLQELVKESLRVLKPAGLLILETPNPENIVVGTSNFYLDPTHKQPIPSQLLSFVTEHYGFHRTKVLRLQESKKIAESETVTLFNVIDGASPDYAVIAQKEATPEILSLFNTQFETEYGLALETLATRYETGLQKQFFTLREDTSILREDTSILREDTSILRENTSVLDEKLSRIESRLESELQSIYNSRSWRITTPLRWVGHQARLVRQQGLRTRTKAFVKKFLYPLGNQIIVFVNSRPALRGKIINITNKLGIHSSLRSFYLGFSRRHKAAQESGDPNNIFSFISSENQLTPHAQHIFHELKSSIKKNKDVN
jgi:O-antigen chain-terminating methyltransferase